MAEMTSGGPVALSREAEEQAFYHEAALNASWTGVRLAIGVVTSGLGAFVFAFFYLRSLNSHGLWYNTSVFTPPKMWQGTLIMVLVVLSAVAATMALQALKRGNKGTWLSLAGVALLLGVVGAAIQIWQLTSLNFQPGAGGFASVFTGASPVIVVLLFATMIWLEIMIMRGRQIPEISFVEQPPTFTEAASVQRFQANLSAFTLFWNFLAIAVFVIWVLFYLVH